MVFAWLDPDRAVYPYASIYGNRDARERARAVRRPDGLFAGQRDCLRPGALDIPFTTKVGVAAVEKGGPADGKLEPGDIVVSVNGTDVDGVSRVTDKIRPLPVGSAVTVHRPAGGSARGGTARHDVCSRRPGGQRGSGLDPGRGYRFPFTVDLKLNDNIGGPSAGLVFAMGIYDVLTPGSLTGGKAIAGTGEIDGEGNVGAIGGIQQKLVGAQSDGAKLFLVPAENCAEAVAGHHDPDKMRLVKVATLDDAVEDVQAWVEDADAKLPRCTR